MPYISLFDKLRVAAKHVPVSHSYGDTEQGRVLAALVHYGEFGDEFLDAALAAEDDAIAQTNPRYNRGERGPDYGVPQVLTQHESDVTLNDNGASVVPVDPETQALRDRIAELEAEREPAEDLAPVTPQDGDRGLQDDKNGTL